MAVRARVRTVHLDEHALKELARDELRKRAEEAADIARDTAPVESGRYRDSIEVDVDGDEVKLLTTSRIGHLVEWGSINNPAHATLRNAAAEVADRWHEG
jgi:hypothetical protein